MSLKCKHTDSFLLQEEKRNTFPQTPTAVLQMGLTLQFQTFYRKHRDTHTLLRPHTTQTLFKLLFQCNPRKGFNLTTTCTWPGYDCFSSSAGVLGNSVPCPVNDLYWALDWVLGSWVSCGQQKPEDHTVSETTFLTLKCNAADLLCWLPRMSRMLTDLQHTCQFCPWPSTSLLPSTRAPSAGWPGPSLQLSM